MPRSERIDLARTTETGAVLVTPEDVGGATVEALLEWLSSARQAVLAASLKHVAVLFRGFPLDTPAAFEQVVCAIDPSVEPYKGGATDRTAVGKKVYEASRYPPSHHLPIHSETSYLRRYPYRIFFCCPIVAARGGETTLADNRQVLAQLPPRVAEKLRAHGVQYIRNVFSRDNGGLHYRIARTLGTSAIQSWQDMFGTESREEVEAHCREKGMAFSWRDDGKLCLNDVIPAVRRHPLTGEDVLFTQFHIFHVGKGRFGPLTPVAQWLNGVGPDALYGAAYGDGSEIPDEDMAAVREVFTNSERPHAWQKGDLLLVDNLLTGHGRRPFRGARTVWFAQAMAETPG